MVMRRADELRHEIARLVAEYHAEAFPTAPFAPGVSAVPVSGKVFDRHELQAVVDAGLDFWLTAGRFAAELEQHLQTATGTAHARLCNSGSSANLLCVAALGSPRLGDRRLVPGDEIVTVAAGFPTTVNPMLQQGYVPVVVDVEPSTYNADPAQVDAAIGPRTRAIMLAHTLGNPFDVDAITAIAKRHDLWLVEDDCDALGSTWNGRPTGSFGDLASLSFYPAHHITTGEGGCVLTSDPTLASIVESLRDWGRDCWCAPGADNTCGRRFCWQLGDLPYGYDHKYVYSHIGYNLKLTDLQAAVGVAQIAKLPQFTAVRKRNWKRLHDGLSGIEHLSLTRALPGADPSWFGFAITVNEGAPFERYDLVQHLEAHRIATRQLFAGNLLRQPAYVGAPIRVAGSLRTTDLIAERAFWVGVHPGLTDPMVDYMIECITTFVADPQLVGGRSGRMLGRVEVSAR